MSKFQTIVVTGANGSIGSYFQIQTVSLKTRLEETEEAFTAELNSLNLSNYCLIHLSAMTSIKDCENFPEMAYNINVEGTKNLFKAAINTGCKRFIFVSTSHVYKSSNLEEKFTTDAALGPRTVYAKTKLLAEEELLKLSAESIRPIELCIARVFSVLSHKTNPAFLLTSLKERILKKDFSPIPGLDNIRDFLWAEQISEQLTQLASLSNVPLKVNICSGKGTKVREIVEFLYEKNHIPKDKIVGADPSPNDIKYIVGEPFFKSDRLLWEKF